MCRGNELPFINKDIQIAKRHMGKVLNIINSQGNENQNKNKIPPHTCCSISKSCLTLCDSMDWLQHTRLPCPSLSSRVYSYSCPLSWWCHSAISSSITIFSSCPQFFPVSGSFPITQLFASGGQSTGASALASVLPMNIQCWFTLGLIWSPSVHELSRVFSNTTVWKY